jgi:hypothetical protein
MAVLNYERARLLDPADPDIRANLRHVRETAGLASPAETRFDRITRLASPLLLAWLGLSGVAIAGLSLIARTAYPRHRLTLAATAALGVALLGVTASGAFAVWPALHAAVILSTTAPARVSPVPMGDPLFVLREAEIVTITARHDSFVLVRNSTGRQGWVSSDNLAPVVPPAGGS